MSREIAEERLVRVTLEELKERRRRGELGQTDWARLDAMTEEDLERAIADDPDSDPPVSEQAQEDSIWVKDGIARVPIRMELELFHWYASLQRDVYQTMLTAIREYKERHEADD